MFLGVSWVFIHLKEPCLSFKPQRRNTGKHEQKPQGVTLRFPPKFSKQSERVCAGAHGDLSSPARARAWVRNQILYTLRVCSVSAANQTPTL